jgi:hypothetical protein
MTEKRSLGHIGKSRTEPRMMSFFEVIRVSDTRYLTYRIFFFCESKGKGACSLSPFQLNINGCESSSRQRAAQLPNCNSTFNYPSLPTFYK